MAYTAKGMIDEVLLGRKTSDEAIAPIVRGGATLLKRGWPHAKKFPKKAWKFATDIRTATGLVAGELATKNKRYLKKRHGIDLG